MWRYAIGRGDEDPARAEFVEQVEARISEQSLQARRRQAARKATESLRAKLKAAGIDPHTYYSMLAQRGNAARWRKQDAGPPQAECAPAPPQASQAHAQAQAEAGQAQAVAGAALATSQSVTGGQAPQAAEAAESTPRRTGMLPVHLL